MSLVSWLKKAKTPEEEREGSVLGIGGVSRPSSTRIPAPDPRLTEGEKEGKPEDEEATAAPQGSEEEPGENPREEAGETEAEELSGTVFLTDNLEVMKGMASETVGLIYADPPPFHRRHRAKHGEDSGYAEAHDDARRLDDHEEDWFFRQKVENGEYEANAKGFVISLSVICDHQRDTTKSFVILTQILVANNHMGQTVLCRSLTGINPVEFNKRQSNST